MEQRLQSILKEHYGKDLDSATDQQVYTALMLYTKEQMAAMPPAEGKRKLYYCLLYTSPSPRDCS